MMQKREAPTASEFCELVGLVLRHGADGTCTSELALQPHHLSIAARVHGGVLATMLDTTMGGAVFSGIPEGRGCATLTLNLHFIRPVTEGKLTCVARLRNLTRQTAYVTGEISDENGRLIAAASGTFFLTPTMTQAPKEFAP